MKKHILFVDDEAPTRELVSLHLRKQGFDVTTAVTCAESRALLEQRTFDLAIVDIDLAGENGMDLLSFAKEKNPDFPVLLFTGLHFDDELMHQARLRKADGCLSKTQSLRTLTDQIRRLIPESVPT